ncbi:hypothetical protein B0H66DRAFT_530857 [Apodospora peruviana]|uniref:Uncharacterized protein n=1 Tax=Apodospora peruviana TaxID=516989 RepID=A0AAE0MCN5_9PEZI|nr:hypothetical protein B0H66DRAFT_530857 [Apodospora peruviana]
MIQTTFNISQPAIATIIYHVAKTSTLESMMTALTGSHDISASFEQVAKPLTFRMREASGVTVAGDAKQTIMFICVRWAFGIFPVVVFAVGLIFSLGSAWESHSLGLGALKTDSLATLLQRLDSDTRDMMKVTGLSPKELSVMLKDGDEESHLWAEEP